MIIIADAGPLLHLHCVEALTWALPDQPIEVVEEVWTEVEKFAPDALRDSRLHRCVIGQLPARELSRWRLDPGERMALSYALAQRKSSVVLVLCDEREARLACRDLSIPITGSIGLIVEASRAGRVARKIAEDALRALPNRGRLYVEQYLIDITVAGLL
mgnify:CR=1 FL=1